MKKLIFTLITTFLIQLSFSQTTYYWVGGTAGSWSDANSWSSTLGGAGGARLTPAVNDILVFDGTNIGGTPGQIAIQPVAETIGSLKILNGADLALQRTSSGTTYLVIAGLGTSSDLLVDATSILRATGDLGAMVPVLGPAALGQISGQVYITGTAANRFSIQGVNALTFLNGSTCTGSSNTAAFSTTTTTTNPSVDKAVLFVNGSTYIYKGGSNPFGGSSSNIIQFQTGSTFVFEATIASGILSNSRFFSNLIVRNNTSVTADGNPFNVDNITVASGSTLLLRISGTFPVTGNITNNGTFGAASGVTSSNLVMYGTTPQTIGGTGTFNPFGAISIATGSEVILQKSLVLNGTTSSSVTGKLNTGTNTLSGTNNWNGKAASTTNFTGNTAVGSQSITNLSVFSGIGIGSVISGPGIPAGSIIIATSLGTAPGGNVTISKPATATGTAVALVGVNASPTLQTANTGGVDGSIAVTGTKTFGDGMNYIFDAITTTPFPAASASINAGNVTANAGITLNKNVTITNGLSLNSSKVIVPAGSVLELASSATITGATSSNYIVTEVNTTTGTQGALKMSGFTTAKTFPVGSATNYLPVTLTPVSTSDFTVTAFEGITNDGTPNGTAMTSSQKAEVVNAVWTINRTSANTDNCDVTLNWTSALEGATFASLANNQIGIARHNGTSWGIVGGSGDNSSNFATNTFSSFSPFGVGRKGVVLPLKFINFNAILTNNKVLLKWNVQNELGLDKYTVERSANGVNFSPITNVTAKNLINTQYDATDAQSLSGTSYYRIKSVSTNGDINYTGIVKVGTTKTTQLEVYPNPVKGNTINLSFVPATEGSYTMILINSAGQQVMNKSLGLVQSNYNSSVVLSSNIQPGLYTLIIKSAENQMKQTLLIQ